MEAVERRGGVAGSQVMFREGATYPSPSEVYEDLIRRIVVFKAHFGIEGPEVDEAWLASALPQEPCVLTHGDLSDDNIIVTPDGLCLIDWECSGFTPRSISRVVSEALGHPGLGSRVVQCPYEAARHSALHELPEFSTGLLRLHTIRLETSGAEGKTGD